MPLCRLTLAALALAACRTPAPEHGGALAARIGAWIPDDAVMVIALGEPEAGEAEAIDAIAASLEVPRPGRFLEVPPQLAIAWHDAGVEARGVAWMQLEDDDGPMARCALVGDEAKAAAALVAAGGTASASGGAAVVVLGETTTVLRDGVACAITDGAPSRREHHALRLATLGDDERLLSRAEAREALARVDHAAYVGWGTGTMIGAGIHESLAATLGVTERAVGVDYDAVTNELQVTVDVPDATIAIGDYAARGPAPLPEILLPAVPVDGNADVPFSEAYQQALGDLQAIIADATAHAAAIARADVHARVAWIDAWGTAVVTTGTLRWHLPAAPAKLRGDADAAYLAAARGAEGEVGAYQAATAAAATATADLIKLRAHDVAAWDCSH